MEILVNFGQELCSSANEGLASALRDIPLLMVKSRDDVSINTEGFLKHIYGLNFQDIQEWSQMKKFILASGEVVAFLKEVNKLAVAVLNNGGHAFDQANIPPIFHLLAQWLTTH